MALSQTHIEYLQRARTNFPVEPIITFIESLFLAKLAAPQKTPLMYAAKELFTKHWTGATGQGVLVPAHDSLDFVARTCTEWQADLRRLEASAAHATKFQAHVAVWRSALLTL